MGFVTLPNALTNGTIAFGSETRANEDAVVAQVNGNIEDVNISAAAAISARKLSTVAGLKVDEARIEADAVTATILRDDATVDANRAVTTNHLRDSAVTTAKIGAAQVILSKIKTTTSTWTPGGTILAGQSINSNTGVTTAQGVPLAIEMRFAGAPAGVQGLTAIPWFFLNTSTNTYFIALGNPSLSGPVSVAGLTFVATFIAVA